MSNADVLGRYGAAMMQTFGIPPRVLVRGAGPWVWTPTAPVTWTSWPASR